MRALAKQVAIVTGAANGIGRELAKQLSAAGCHLALADIDEAGLKSLKEDLNRRSSTISVHAIDVAREDSVKALVEDVVSIHQRISIVINNAGVSISAPFEKVKVEDFERLFATNFWGAIHLCRHSLRFLKAEPEARIVNVLSAFALLGVPSKTAYCSSKAALLGFSNSLYAELFDTGVRVAVAFPPAVDTNLVRKGMAYDEDQKRQEQDFVARHSMHVEPVARKIISGMMKGKFRIRIGPTVRVVDLMSRYFPTVTHTLLARNKSRIDFL